jgi:hypothetical protein
MIKSAGAALFVCLGLQLGMLSGASSAGIEPVEFFAAKEQSVTQVTGKRAQRQARYRYNRRFSRARRNAAGRGIPWYPWLGRDQTNRVVTHMY